MLEVKDVNQFYGGSHILRDVSFQAPVGECSVVLGRNGAAKGCRPAYGRSNRQTRYAFTPPRCVARRVLRVGAPERSMDGYWRRAIRRDRVASPLAHRRQCAQCSLFG